MNVITRLQRIWHVCWWLRRKEQKDMLMAEVHIGLNDPDPAVQKACRNFFGKKANG